MIRGTRFLRGEDAKNYREIINTLSAVAVDFGYEEIIVPSLWDQQTFIDKAGTEIINQMWAFKDKGERDVCLIPEVTAIVRKLIPLKEKAKVFYVQRCYRYERPQAGRYREFTQFGLECLGQDDDVIKIASAMADAVGINYTLNQSVKRGLDYYIESGFEIECPSLGSQKQVCGGGKYEDGIGFAFGVDRLMIANIGAKK